MQYQKPTFTLPTVNKRMTQTEYEIAVGLRNSDGTLVRIKKPPQVFNIRSGAVALPNQWAELTDRQRKQWLAAHDYQVCG